MFGKLICFLATGALVACADPNYAKDDDSDSHFPTQKPLSCQAKFATGECVHLEWEKKPTDDDFGQFLLKIFRENSAGATALLLDLPGDLSVTLWMPSMGHGSSPVTVERLDVGTFRASKVFFTMSGEWDIYIKFNTGSSVENQATISLTY